MTKRDKTLTDEQAKFWSRKEYWEIPDAALLFIGVDPDSDLGTRLKKTLRNEYGFSFDSLSEEEKARCAQANEIIDLVQDSDMLTLHERWAGTMLYCVVRPREFLVLARDKFERDPPEALQSIIAGVPSRTELEQELQRLRSLVGELQEKSRNRGQSEDLEPGERSTMRKLSAYLAKKYQYDQPAQKSHATGKLRAELQKFGIQLDDKTIRRLLNLGAEQSSE